MATKRSDLTEEQIKKMDIYERLLHIRQEFHANPPKKTGINMKMAFDWFQLDDIMPMFLKLCDKYRVVSVTKMYESYAEIGLVVIDKLDEGAERAVTVSIPVAENEVIKTNDGRSVTSPMQALGAGITYMRRYLYYVLLDLTQLDEINETLGAEKEDAKAQKVSTRKPPVTVEKREEIKEKVSAPEGQAPTMLIKSLTRKLSDLKNLDEGETDYIKQIAARTKKFTEISKMDCENLILEVNAKIKTLKEGK